MSNIISIFDDILLKKNYDKIDNLLKGGDDIYIKNDIDCLLGGKFKKKRKRVREIAENISQDEILMLKEIPDALSLFPTKTGINIMNLKMNRVGIYSLTKPKEAKDTLDIIKKHIDPKKSVLLDATAGIGGFIFNISDEFKKVIGYEIDEEQFELLKHNLKIYGIKNAKIRNKDFTENLGEKKGDVVIVDPPWGGLDYKSEKKLNLKLGELTMNKLVDKLNVKLILLKLPINHDLDIFKKYNHYVEKINNYLMVVIKK
tara:strand:- start:8 stop:781 length:774 start_codon:yes stop_codon:yes gene_type:complete